MKIYIGSDHAGFDLKEKLKDYLRKQDYAFEDIGTYSKEPVDYPDIAKSLIMKITSGMDNKGILICATGIGMTIAANRDNMIRAALCQDVRTAKMSREHNDANILVMGSEIVSDEMSRQITKTFLETKFSNEERHKRRIDKLDFKN